MAPAVADGDITALTHTFLLCTLRPRYLVRTNWRQLTAADRYNTSTYIIISCILDKYGATSMEYVHVHEDARDGTYPCDDIMQNVQRQDS